MIPATDQIPGRSGKMEEPLHLNFCTNSCSHQSLPSETKSLDVLEQSCKADQWSSRMQNRK